MPYEKNFNNFFQIPNDPMKTKSMNYFLKSFPPLSIPIIAYLKLK